jgi:leucine-rich repeat protein SHOC2
MEDLFQALTVCGADSHIDLSSNGLTSLRLPALPSLHVLQLEHNQLQALSDNFLEGCASLVRLDLSHNELAALPVSLARLPALQRLIASNNQLSEVPHGLGALRNLRELDLRC